MEEKTLEEPTDVVEVKGRAKWKIKIEQFLENYIWIILMSVVTFYALFFDDLRILFLPMEADMTCDIITVACIFLYTVELILGSVAVEGYFFSFYFWVDAVSLISMLPDVTFIVNAIEGGFSAADGASDIAKTGRATKVVKVIRIIRIIRLLRIVKIYKQVKTGQKIKNKNLAQNRESAKLMRASSGVRSGTKNKVQPSDNPLYQSDSEDSIDREMARVDKDISNGIYEKDLVLEDRLAEQN